MTRQSMADHNLHIMPRSLNRPLLDIDQLLRWQLQVAQMIGRDLSREALPQLADPNKDDSLLPIPGLAERTASIASRVHIIYDKTGKSGKRVFCNAMKYDFEQAVLVLLDLPSASDYWSGVQALKASKAWVGGCLIIETPTVCGDAIDVLEEIASDPDCKSLWVFMTSKIAPDYRPGWQYYGVQSDWNRGIVSNLIPMKCSQA